MRPLRRATILLVLLLGLHACSEESEGAEPPPGDETRSPTTLRSTETSSADAPGAPGGVEVAWAQVLAGPTAEDEIDGVAAAPDGGAWITGKFEQRTTFAETTLESAGAADVPLARLDADGEARWVQRFGGTGEDNLFDIDADERGAVATGWFEGTVGFGDVTLTSAGRIDCVVVAFADDGAVRWARALGGPGPDGCNEVTIGPDGSIVTSLDTVGGWDSPAGRLAASPDRDTLLLRLDPDGEIEWGRAVAGPRTQRGKALAVGPDGDIAFGGDTNGDLALAGEVVARPGGGYDAWLSAWTPEGELRWVEAWGGAGDDLAKGVVWDATGVYVVGPVSGTVEVGTTTIEAGDTSDLLVAQVAPEGRIGWATTVEATGPVAGAEAVAAPGGGLLFASAGLDGLRLHAVDGTVTEVDERAGGTAWVAQYLPDGEVGLAVTIPGTSGAGADEIARVGDRAYLDLVIRGADTRVDGEPLVADRKDGSLWALDLLRTP